MRYLLALLLATTSLGAIGSQAANAADLPVKARTAPIDHAWSWNGLYIGAHVGGGWGTIESEISLGGVGAFPVASAAVNGFLGGGQIGYNIQRGIVVFGVEADASWSGMKGTTPCLIVLSCKREVEALGTITGRLGFTADRALIYVKGGGAWAHVNHDVSIFGVNLARADKTVWGWTVGTGIEYAITSNWSARVEYNFMDFAKSNTAFTATVPGVGAGTFNVDTTQYLHAVKFGVNYRFAHGPIVARY
jgi:outer membrane immunogenic protein